MKIKDPTKPVPRDEAEEWMSLGEWKRRHEAKGCLAEKGEGKVECCMGLLIGGAENVF